MKMTGGKSKLSAPTVEQITGDKITELSDKYWAHHIKKEKVVFDPNVVDEIYLSEIRGSSFSIRRIMLLEFSQYLENYLWPNYDPNKVSAAHIMSIVIMVNEKFRERVPAWEVFIKKPDHFSHFFHQVLKVLLEKPDKYSLKEQTALLVYLNHSLNSVEVDLIRGETKHLISPAMWVSLLEGRREQEFKNLPKLKKFWKILKKKDSQADEQTVEKQNFERTFLYNLMQKFFLHLDEVPEKGEVNMDVVHFCERCLELIIDLEALLITRRFFNTLLDDCHLVVKCNMSHLISREEGRLFSQLLDNLKFYARFEINDQTGEALSDHNMTDAHYKQITSLQIAAFKHFPELNSFSLSNVAKIDKRENLLKIFLNLSVEKLREIAAYLNLVPSADQDQEKTFTKEFLAEILIYRHERRASQLEALNEMPLYPTEDIIWDENVVPMDYFSGEGCLALPKLNLQFLTLHDYLLRNFSLFQLESTYEIRQDVEDSVRRLKPWLGEEGNNVFGGWARMAQPITNFTIVEVAKPNIGEKQPSRVRADVTVHLNVRYEIKQEWEALRKHDVCFLITVRPRLNVGSQFKSHENFIQQVGLTYVRGCEIEGLLDHNGRIIEEGPEPKPDLIGDNRTFRIWLDSNQYRTDMDELNRGGEDIYETFNILMRRKPKENNFKAVLETIRDLMNTNCVVPEWLHDIILGYGNPAAAHYSNMPNQIATLDFNDTFLDIDHLKSSFPDHEIITNCEPGNLCPPFRLTFKEVDKNKTDSVDSSKGKNIILAESHVIPNRGPYPYNQPKKNCVHFTPTQVEAIRAGMQPGLTMVVGPPGTGKTDVAVQIISNIYHSFPEQRTLIVTHSNQALNQLFEKIMALDIDERHLLRLGHGEEALETEKDFSRYGRVNYVLAKRLELLQEVQRLQESLDVPGDVSYTCETAGHFFLYQVLARWEAFVNKLKKSKKSETIIENFPFSKFFDTAPQPIFKGQSYKEDMDIAEGCFRHIRKIFTQLEEFRAFELLRSGIDRSRYLLVREAKIIAMTCTHAALKRKELVELGFKYDNILMEEAAQILEIETFIPLLLQNPEDGFSRLKRWIMIGDHHQLPPVIKNMAFQKYSNMEQSLFTRFVRLGVPTIDLDAQGRARPSICTLYNWRYKKLGNLPHVNTWPEYCMANAGFGFDYQLINVDDFNGVGETEPIAYFYQNLAEAEYLVAVYTYMRLLGYPAEKITILTTYNGQKLLLRDVIKEKCEQNPLIGRPHKVTTVDKYQGQQNDFILLSLVRTKAVGHLRDVRRLIVAMSRARLGLYVFARVSLFKNCFELTPAFNLLMQRPLNLHLLPQEMYQTTRQVSAVCEDAIVINDLSHMASFVLELYQHKLQMLQANLEAQRLASNQAKEEREAQPVNEETKMEVDNDDDDDEDDDDDDDEDN
uniref:RNA helicase aquarius n=1 Tax=Strigamia maritima TaxID=126957 RepID=T1J5U4_STRMM